MMKLYGVFDVTTSQFDRKNENPSPPVSRMRDFIFSEQEYLRENAGGKKRHPSIPA